MSVYDQQQEIKAELEKIRIGPTGFKVYEGAVDDGEKWTVEEGLSGVPFMALQFAGFSQTPKNIKHMTGARHNSNDMIFSVTVVANTDGTTRKLWDKVCTALIGFEPTNSGEIQPALFASSGKISFLGSPTRYTSIQSFTYISNSYAPC